MRTENKRHTFPTLRCRLGKHFSRHPGCARGRGETLGSCRLWHRHADLDGDERVQEARRGEMLPVWCSSVETHDIGVGVERHEPGENLGRIFGRWLPIY